MISAIGSLPSALSYFYEHRRCISTTADSACDEMARAVTGGGGSEIPGLTRFDG